MNELKPCLFCGAPAKRSVQAASSYSPGSYKCAAYCTRGSCGAAINLIYHPPLWIENPERQAKATITRAWNRRDDNAFSDNPKEIEYLKAAEILYAASEKESEDVAAVRRGRWKWSFDCGLLWCSACGWNIEEDVSDYAYCPNCGAKMDLEE